MRLVKTVTRTGRKGHRAQQRRLVILFAICSLTVGLLVSICPAASPEPMLSARETRELANKLIPFSELTEESQEKLWSVIGRPTIHRRIPAQTVDCDSDLHLFMVRNPEVVVNMWQLMGVTNIQLKRRGPFHFDASDGAGTQSTMELVYGTADTHILFGEGYYEGPLLKRKINGRCVMVLKTSYGQGPNQRSLVSDQVDVFMQLDNVGADLIAKTLQPIFGKTAEHNFAETVAFVGRVSQAVERNPNGAERLAAKLDKVTPEVRQQFVKVATSVSERSAARLAPYSETSTASNNEILPATRVSPPESAGIRTVVPRR